MTKQELEQMVGQRVYWWEEYDSLLSFTYNSGQLKEFCGDSRVFVSLDNGMDYDVPLTDLFATPVDCIANQVAIYENRVESAQRKLTFEQHQLDRFKGMLAYAKEVD